MAEAGLLQYLRKLDAKVARVDQRMTCCLADLRSLNADLSARAMARKKN
jgi:hypothetical protein